MLDYQQTLTGAREKLKSLAAQRDAIDREIAAVLRIIEGAQIASQDPSQWNPDSPSGVPKNPSDAEPVGMTESVRKILRRSSVGLLPTEIRDALELMGIEGSSPKNLLIHVHKVLGRLLENEEVGQVPRDGKMAYRLDTSVAKMMRQLNESMLGINRDSTKTKK